MIKYILILITPLMVFSASPPVPVPNVQMDCFEHQKPRKWSFCINRYNGSKSKSLVIYLHGKSGGIKRWNNLEYDTGKLYQTWQKLGLEAPTVVSISFGKLWFLAHNPSTPKQGLFYDFIHTSLPEIYSKLNQEFDKKILFGISMGGVNTLMTIMKTKTLFDKAASICPPITNFSPHAPFQTIWKYYLRSSISTWRTFQKVLIGKKLYPDLKSWQANDPIILAKAIPKSYLPSKIYLSCGAKDTWECMEGSLEIKKIFESKGVDLQWVPKPGGHCDIDQESLALFLAS